MITAEVSAYSESANPDVLPDLRDHLDASLEVICRLLNGDRVSDLDFVQAHASRRAEQKFPLDAVLQTYRCLHRMLSIWIRDAALEVADDDAHVRRVVAAVTDLAIEYTSAVSSFATSAYVSQTRRLAEAEGDLAAACGVVLDEWLWIEVIGPVSVDDQNRTFRLKQTALRASSSPSA